MSKQAPELELLTVPVAAQRMSISQSMLWKLIRLGAIPVVKLGTKSIRVDMADLTKFIARRKALRK